MKWHGKQWTKQNNKKKPLQEWFLLIIFSEIKLTGFWGAVCEESLRLVCHYLFIKTFPFLLPLKYYLCLPESLHRSK